jgi:hypothetical protein
MRFRTVGFLLANVCVIFGAALPGTANAASPVLSAGLYHYSFSSYSFCRTTLGANSSDFGPGSFLYTGPGKSGSTMTYTSGSGSLTAFSLSTYNTIQILDLPVVPSAGPSKWAGAYKGQIYTYQSGGGVAGKATTIAISGTISLSLTALTANTFYGTMSFAPKGLKSCTVQVVGGP